MKSEIIRYGDAVRKAFTGLLPFFGPMYLHLEDSYDNDIEKAELQLWKTSVEQVIAEQEEAITMFKHDILELLGQIDNSNIGEHLTNIIWPAFDFAKYHIKDEGLRKMFANLIVSSIDRNKQHLTHPSFVDVIRQLSPYDAYFLQAVSDASIRNESVRNITPNGISYVVAELRRTKVDKTPLRPIFTDTPSTYTIIQKSKKDFHFRNVSEDEYEKALIQAALSYENLLRLNLVQERRDINTKFGMNGREKSEYMKNFTKIGDSEIDGYEMEWAYEWYEVKLTDYGISFCDTVIPVADVAKIEAPT